VSTGVLDDLDETLARGGEPDDVLRSVVRRLVDEPGIVWAGIAFLEDGGLTLGPEAGAADTSCRVCVPVSYQGARIGELWIDGEVEEAFLRRVAAVISTHVLIGWDTRGESWNP
jgi:putative methionine-R-sulfoxide reductase with GAF domain